MRLLDTTTIKLSEFFDDDIPPYAILSHTWGKNEVSFKDLDRVRTKGPHRYYKIARCCALAASQGYKWVWIDTCCIDKTSSAELSEAINSMFRWYQRSETCYAYLEDVSSDDMDKFGSSRWFTRGWTLQELLAPWDVQFYDKRWTKLGSKRSLREAVAVATGIPKHCIDPEFVSELGRESVAARMSWASTRQTSRVEDTAYSLMGLLEVNMPLLYGEGPKAFTRLQHEIVKNIDDESVYAWTDDDLAISGMFAPSPAAFLNSGDIVATDFPQFYRSEPNTVTSRGLSIELVSKIKDPRYNNREMLPLHCAWSKDRTAAIMVQIRKYGNPNMCWRNWPCELELMDVNNYDSKGVETRRIYVR